MSKRTLPRCRVRVDRSYQKQQIVSSILAMSMEIEESQDE